MIRFVHREQLGLSTCSSLSTPVTPVTCKASTLWTNFN